MARVRTDPSRAVPGQWQERRWGSRGSNPAKANYEFAAFTRLLDPRMGGRAWGYHIPRTERLLVAER